MAKLSAKNVVVSQKVVYTLYGVRWTDDGGEGDGGVGGWERAKDFDR